MDKSQVNNLVRRQIRAQLFCYTILLYIYSIYKSYELYLYDMKIYPRNVWERTVESQYNLQ